MNVDLEKLAALSAAATKGPWNVTEDGDQVELNPSEGDWAWIPCEPQDAALIAAMRNNIDALVAECLAAREWLKADDAVKANKNLLARDGRLIPFAKARDAAREAYRKLVAGGEK